MAEDIYSDFEKSLPLIISRTAVPKLTGGLVTAGHLANLDTRGLGPRNRIRIFRKVAYPRADFVAWLRSHCVEVGDV